METPVRKILIAEDDPVSLKILEGMLRKWGYEPMSAVDGAKAWDLYVNNPDIQVIISDWMMPELDGISLCRRVRKLDRRSYTYFIMLTAKTQTYDMVTGMEAGADDFIGKPFEKQELKVRLRAGERIVELENELANKVDALSMVNEQMQSDIEASSIVLQNMLPPESGRLLNVKYASCFEPCERIGGDLYNIMSFDYNSVGMYILDVSGHGVQAALQTLSLGMALSTHDPQTSLLLKQNESAGSKIAQPPGDVATRLNTWLDHMGPGNKFLTFLYAVLDSENGIFTYARAGHPYPILLKNGDMHVLSDLEGIPIGIVPGYAYQEQSVQLQKGDRIYLYTDGIPEANGNGKGLFGDRRLCESIAATRSQTLDKSIQSIRRDVWKWLENKRGSDDMCLLGIEYDPE